jgi:hypothetical protein
MIYEVENAAHFNFLKSWFDVSHRDPISGIIQFFQLKSSKSLRCGLSYIQLIVLSGCCFEAA